MKLYQIALIAALVILQYHLWVGEGNFSDIRSLETTLNMQKERHQAANARNIRLMSEIQLLKSDQSMIETQARYEHNMIKQGEEYYQIAND